MKNLNGSGTGIAFPLYLIMMMWEFADSEKGLEHFAEGVYSMISYAMLKNSIMHTDMVRKHGYIFNHEQQTLETIAAAGVVRESRWQLDNKVLREKKR